MRLYFYIIYKMSFIYTNSDENPLGEVAKNYMPELFFFEETVIIKSQWI